MGCDGVGVPAPRAMGPSRWEPRLCAAGVMGRDDGREARASPSCPRQVRTLGLIPEGNGASTSIFSRQEKTMLRFVVFERSLWSQGRGWEVAGGRGWKERGGEGAG